MTAPQRLGVRWFFYGALLSIFVLAIMRVRDIELLVHGSDTIAALVLGILATVQLGIMMPTICIIMRYRADAFNFWNALLLLIGFTVGSSAIVAYYGSYFFALVYVVVSSGMLTAFYLLTHALHRRIHETKK